MTGWQTKKLSDVAYVTASNVDKITHADEIPVKLCNYMDVYRGSYIDDSAGLAPGSVQQRELDEYKLLKGQVLITKDSETPEDIARSAYVAKDFDDVVCGYHLAILSPKEEELDGRFLKRIFDVPSYQFYFSRLANGVTRFGITQPAIKDARITLPDKPEQERIVGVLEVWDEYIDKLEQKIALKEQLKKGLMQQLLTGKRRLPGFSEVWRAVALGGIARIDMGQSPSSSSYNEKGDGLVLIQGNADMKNGRTIERIWTTEVTKSASKGSLIMTVRAPVGEIAISTQDVCLGRGVCAISSDYDGYLRAYLSWFKPKWLRFIQGSTFESVSGTDIRGLKVSLPNTKEAEAIVDIITNAESSINILVKTLEAAKMQKKYLLNNLITGTIRTPENLPPKGVN